MATTSRTRGSFVAGQVRPGTLAAVWSYCRSAAGQWGTVVRQFGAPDVPDPLRRGLWLKLEPLGDHAGLHVVPGELSHREDDEQPEAPALTAMNSPDRP